MTTARPAEPHGPTDAETRLWPGRADVPPGPPHPPEALPRGDEPDLVASPVPQHLVPLVEAATAASARAGVKHVAACWAACPGGPGVLLIMLSVRAGQPAGIAALDEAAAVIERRAPSEPVRVVMTSVLGVARAVSFSKAGLPRRRGGTERRGRIGFNVPLALIAALVGAHVISVPSWTGWHGAVAVAFYVLGGLIVAGGVGAAFTEASGRKHETAGSGDDADGPPPGEG